ncbi:speckle-type POZ protein-like [Trichogramma pretiosum]|uniref:speckle-type POZ protein-like n=1 Tax=Trichogramma pretiosum TaxID=7493 RepID=UPI0006C96689|nr:speckle-type POZ protein-like [Trichogramma pretiosum]
MSHFDMCGRLLTNSEWSSFWWELAWGSMELLKHGFMTSPALYVDNNEEKTFRLELHRSLAVDAVNPQAGRPCVRLILAYLNRASLPCSYNVSIVKDNKVIDVQQDDCSFAPSNSERQIFNICPNLLRTYVSSTDILTINCQFKFPPSIEESSSSKPDVAVPTFNFDWIFLNENLSDVTLRTASGIKIPAHRVVLAAASPVFRAMFSHDMMENQSQSVDMADIGYEAAVEMLQYIYTGSVKTQEFSLTAKVLAAAEKYQLEKLKSECERILVANLTTENAIEALKIADTFGTSHLKREAVDFVRRKINGKLQLDEISDMLINKAKLHPK